MRPEELHDLKGDASKAKEILGWEPTIGFEEMMDEMVEYWLDYYRNPKLI
jgi:GDPmannose 4,6-dehydratase